MVSRRSTVYQFMLVYPFHIVCSLNEAPAGGEDKLTPDLLCLTMFQRAQALTLLQNTTGRSMVNVTCISDCVKCSKLFQTISESGLNFLQAPQVQHQVLPPEGEVRAEVHISYT